jgi:hypothetical protein
MRRPLLLISLCLIALLMLASVALADTTMSASPSASASGSSWPPCSSPDVICDYASPGSPTSASVSASALSPSGGVSPLKLATLATLLLVGSGLLSLRILRRG